MAFLLRRQNSSTLALESIASHPAASKLSLFLCIINVFSVQALSPHVVNSSIPPIQERNKPFMGKVKGSGIFWLYILTVEYIFLIPCVFKNEYWVSIIHYTAVIVPLPLHPPQRSLWTSKWVQEKVPVCIWQEIAIPVTFLPPLSLKLPFSLDFSNSFLSPVPLLHWHSSLVFFNLACLEVSCLWPFLVSLLFSTPSLISGTLFVLITSHNRLLI